MLKVDASDLMKVVRRMARRGEINPRRANAIVRQEFAAARARMARAVASSTGLTLAQARRRVRVSKGRRRPPRRVWMYRGLYSRGSAVIVHAGRLKTVAPRGRGARRRKSGVAVAGKRIPRSFLYNPAGRTLPQRKRRVYRRTSSGIRAVSTKDIGRPNIVDVFRRTGPRVLHSTVQVIGRRLMREAVLR